MKALLCWLFGHNWTRTDPFDVVPRRCRWCGRREE